MIVSQAFYDPTHISCFTFEHQSKRVLIPAPISPAAGGLTPSSGLDTHTHVVCTDTDTYTLVKLKINLCLTPESFSLFIKLYPKAYCKILKFQLS